MPLNLKMQFSCVFISVFMRLNLIIFHKKTHTGKFMYIQISFQFIFFHIHIQFILLSKTKVFVVYDNDNVHYLMMMFF